MRKAGFIVYVMAIGIVGCGRAPAPAESPAVTPVYNADTGRLEEILSDRDGDGRNETRAFMDGTRLDRIEIDRNGDGVVDRWEHYAMAGEPPAAVITRAEEAGGAGPDVTRWEYYEEGHLTRVEEDTSLDGRVDKWEIYEGGRLARVDLDLAGTGRPTRRLIYAADGSVAAAEFVHDGTFEPAPPAASGR